MDYGQQYGEFRKPSWAPPAWLFGPVWAVLYIGIAWSFALVFYGAVEGLFPAVVAIPFVLNLIFNFLFTPLEFRLRNRILAFIDVSLTLVTLAWALIAIAPWWSPVVWVNIPYLAWVIFATILEGTVMAMN